MQYFVYILISQETNRPTTYVGYTNNLKNRLQLHNRSKGAKYTKGKLWKIIYKKKYKTKSEAMKYEYKLKKDRRKRSLIKLKYLSKL